MTESRVLDDLVLVDRYVDEWQRRLTSTEPADFDALTDAIGVLYMRAGHAGPHVIIRTASIEAALERAVGCASTGMRLPEPLSSLIFAGVWGWREAVAIEFQERIDEVGDRLRSVRDTIVQMQPLASRSESESVRREESGTSVRRVWFERGFGVGDGPDIASTTVARAIGIPVDEEILETATVLCGAAAWWAYEGTAILVDRPALWRRDPAGRLHAEDGPAWRTRDGHEHWAWHGVLVPSDLVLVPASLDLDWLRPQSLAIRRAAMERIGWETALDRFQARHVSTDEWGSLYRVADTLVVRVTNSTPERDGTFVDHFLMVHPECRPMLDDFGTLGDSQPLTALNAIASTFGLMGEEYAQVEAMT